MNEIKSPVKLLQALIACKLAEKDELNGDYAKYNHGIEKYVYSNAHRKEHNLVELGIKKLFSKHVICQSSKENKKRLIIAVTITNQEDKDTKSNIFTDFFGSFESTSESTVYKCEEFKHINKCIVHHGSIIPIGHLIDKLNENYELVFTGYCFGAALAAFLAIRVLTDQSLQSKTDKLNNVSFIGFGCPSFVKNEFKTFIEKIQHNDKFEFYRHENDFYANFFDLNSHILVGNNNNNSDLVKDIAKNSYSFYDYQSVSNQDILKYLSKMKMQSYSLSNQSSQKHFVQFGIQGNSKENINQTNDIKALISKLEHVADTNQITKIEGYFEHLKSNLDQLIDNVKGQNVEKLNPIGDFDLLNSDKWKFHQYYPDFHNKYEFPEKKDNTANNQQPEDEQKSHYTVIVVELPQETNVLLGVWKSNKNWSTYFCATMSSTNSTNVVLSNRINVGDHVDWLSFSCSKEFASKSKFKFNIFSFYNKDSVSLDASGMLHIIVPNEQEKDNDKAISVFQLAVDLLFVNALIFVYVVEKMSRREEKQKKTIEDDWFKDDSDHLIDTFHKMQRYLKREKIFNDRKKENDVFYGIYKDYEIVSDLPKNVDWKSNIPCREQFKNALKKPTLKEYVFELLPIIYFLKQAQVSSFENAQPLWTDLTSSYLKYDCQVGLLAFRRAMWYFKNSIEDDLKYDRACKETTEQLYNIEKEEKSSDIQNIVPYKGFYEKSVKRIYDEKQKEMKRIDYEKCNLKEEFLRSMVWNFEIRKTLCENCLIGVTGLKKAGKSSFVDMLTGNNIASSIAETKEMSAYRISDKVNLLLIDYPHINSPDRFYALQFAKSKFMLDYVFVVIDAEQFGKTATNDIKQMLENLKGLGARRFCIIANKFDKFNGELKELKELNDRKAKVIELIDKFKKIVSNYLKEFEQNRKLVSNNDEYTKDLILKPTCLNSKDVLKENVELMEEAGVVFDKNLKKDILDLLCQKIHDKDVIEQIETFKGKFEEDAKKEVRNEIQNKTCTFKYNSITIDDLVNITNDDTKNEDEKNVKSWNYLIEILKEGFSLGDNSFKIKTIEPNSNNQIIEQFEDFFNTTCKDFEIIKNEL